MRGARQPGPYKVGGNMELILWGDAKVVEDEGVDVSGEFDGFGGAAAVVAGEGVDTDEHRIRAAGVGLQGGGIFERVSGHNAVVMIGGGNERGGIVDAGLDIVERRVGVEGLE